MKLLILLGLSILFIGQLNAQVPVTEIVGRLEIFHSLDSTSIYVGKDVGRSANFPVSQHNTFVGNQSGKATIRAEDNTYFVHNSGSENVFGNNNSFFGSRAGELNLEGDNSFFGCSAGLKNTIGNNNSFFGKGSGSFNTTGTHNSYIGVKSGHTNTSGSFNTFIGSNAGRNFSIGNGNICIGYTAGPNNENSFSNKLYLNNEASDTPLIYGEFDNDLVQVNGKLRLGVIDYNNDGASNESVVESDLDFRSDLWLLSQDDIKMEIGRGPFS